MKTTHWCRRSDAAAGRAWEHHRRQGNEQDPTCWQCHCRCWPVVASQYLLHCVLVQPAGRSMSAARRSCARSPLGHWRRLSCVWRVCCWRNVVTLQLTVAWLCTSQSCDSTIAFAQDSSQTVPYTNIKHLSTTDWNWNRIMIIYQWQNDWQLQKAKTQVYQDYPEFSP